jgi:hypothetical protein
VSEAAAARAASTAVTTAVMMQRPSLSVSLKNLVTQNLQLPRYERQENLAWFAQKYETTTG